MGTCLGARVDGVSRRLGVSVVDEGVVVEVDELVVVVEVVELDGRDRRAGQQGVPGGVAGERDGRGGRWAVPDSGGRRSLLGPAGNEAEGVGSGIPGVLGACSCWCLGMCQVCCVAALWSQLRCVGW